MTTITIPDFQRWAKHLIQDSALHTELHPELLSALEISLKQAFDQGRSLEKWGKYNAN